MAHLVMNWTTRIGLVKIFLEIIIFLNSEWHTPHAIFFSLEWHFPLFNGFPCNVYIISYWGPRESCQHSDIIKHLFSLTIIKGIPYTIIGLYIIFLVAVDEWTKYTILSFAKNPMYLTVSTYDIEQENTTAVLLSFSNVLSYSNIVIQSYVFFTTTKWDNMVKDNLENVNNLVNVQIVTHGMSLHIDILTFWYFVVIKM